MTKHIKPKLLKAKLLKPKFLKADKLRLNQVGALPFRVVDGEIEVLLVTSRETRRWLIPKGWPMKGKKPHKAAAQEAQEEAGVKGKIADKPLGHYDYWKRRLVHFDLCRVDVYPLEVSKQLKRWKEKGQREARWFKAQEAADQVLEPALAGLIRQLPGKVADPAVSV
ncbi:NUDIX hydrolase [Microvirga pudoricolor]|uniref:NUDIX hydrolase n=1 Tax=Microvirga pudoricolor TaxID=2778729 RepID=UPI00194E5B6C|nr:NUDIX hydrolase [Microvirga pudoricolor]MBM6596734.1 NUDIX hydrolase [Microvirga pudoricolor]